MFCPSCIYCGARLIQVIGTFAIAASVCTARRRVVLADWMAHGHSEQEIRRLAKGPLAIGPVADAESGGRKTGKRR